MPCDSYLVPRFSFHNIRLLYHTYASIKKIGRQWTTTSTCWLYIWNDMYDVCAHITCAVHSNASTILKQRLCFHLCSYHIMVRKTAADHNLTQLIDCSKKWFRILRYLNSAYVQVLRLRWRGRKLVPPRLHGCFSLNGIFIFSPHVKLLLVDEKILSATPPWLLYASVPSPTRLSLRRHKPPCLFCPNHSSLNWTPP